MHAMITIVTLLFLVERLRRGCLHVEAKKDIGILLTSDRMGSGLISLIKQ